LPAPTPPERRSNLYGTFTAPTTFSDVFFVVLISELLEMTKLETSEAEESLGGRSTEVGCKRAARRTSPYGELIAH